MIFYPKLLKKQIKYAMNITKSRLNLPKRF